MTEKSMRGAQTRLIGTGHSYQPWEHQGPRQVWRGPCVRVCQRLAVRAAGLRTELADVLRLAAGRDATPVALRAGAFFATGLAVAAFLAAALVGALFAAAF